VRLTLGCFTKVPAGVIPTPSITENNSYPRRNEVKISEGYDQNANRG